MASEEPWQFSESEDDMEFDPYEDDPVFETNEELQNFLGSCDLGKVKEADEENIDYDSTRCMSKVCTCDKCEDIKSEVNQDDWYEHFCVSKPIDGKYCQ